MAILDELNKAKEDLHLATNLQKMMVSANKILRLKNKTEDEKKVLLRDIVPSASINKLFQPDFAGRTGYPTFRLTNNNASIKRLEQRVKDLEKKFTAQTVDREEIWDFDGGYFENNYDADRVQIFFDSIPDSNLRTELKRAGWNWSPTNKAWQRKITDAAISSAKRILPEVVKRAEIAENVDVEETAELENKVDEEIETITPTEIVPEKIKTPSQPSISVVSLPKYDWDKIAAEKAAKEAENSKPEIVITEPEPIETEEISNTENIAPIVLLWSEEFEDENVPFQNLESLQKYYGTFTPNSSAYTKSKIEAFGMQFRIDITDDKKPDGDYNPKIESLVHYLERRRPNYDWKSLSSFNNSISENNPTLDPSTYANQYVLNKAIEAWLMENVGSLDQVLSREYTTQEKIFLKAYSGYGGLKDLGPTGVDAAFEFYTPKSIIQKMWALAYKHGYKANGSILEPSVGIGEFLQFANPNTRQVAYEISLYSAMITKILYPTVEVNHMPFEKQFISRNYTIGSSLEKLEKFDLVIGNPPYGSFEVLDQMAARYLIGMGEAKHTGATNYVEYFIQRSLALLKPGGLLVFIVGAQLKNGGTLFLDGPITTTKQIVHAYGELLDAYRLPDSVFERTGVTSDILVIKKRVL